jgi:hypothetical protein
MGLLDIWNDWKKTSGYSDDFTGMDSDFDRSTGAIKATISDRAGGSPLTQPGGAMFPTSIVPQNQGQLKVGGKTFNLPQSVLTPEAVKNQKKAIAEQQNKTPTLKQDPAYQDPIMTGGQGTQQAELGFMQRLANMANVDFDKAQATWKDKGGFEGLMANPAFTLGLAFMAAGAEGKSIGQESLNSVLKAGAISQQYKKIIKGRAGDVIEATEGQMNKVKSILGEMGISGPGWRKLLPGNQSASYEQAVEDITLKVNRKVRAMKKAAEKSGRNIEVGTRLYKKIIRDMIDSGEISKKRVFLDETLEAAEPKAMGGPIQAGKPYIVGEEGPEVIIPKSDGNVLTNDDSQIYAMLLAANPQLQKVSKQRAEKILRARFPEYFE